MKKKLRVIISWFSNAVRDYEMDTLFPHDQRTSYRGYNKWRIHKGILDSFIETNFNARSHSIQLELVHITAPNNSDHYHNDTDALVMVLGQKHNFIDPQNALIRVGDYWYKAEEGDTFFFPKKIIHGLTVNEKGSYWVVSVQTPEIFSETKEDFHVIDALPVTNQTTLNYEQLPEVYK